MNVESAEIPIFLQSVGTNSKQKKVQGPMPKSDESAGSNDTFKPNLYILISVSINWYQSSSDPGKEIHCGFESLLEMRQTME
jgi:hypothetical protein